MRPDTGSSPVSLECQNGDDGGVTTDCKSVTEKRRGFESLFWQMIATLAQMVERLPCKQEVVSSNLTSGKALPGKTD